MASSTRKTPNIRGRLNTRLRVNPIWPEIFGAVDAVIAEQVTAPRVELSDVRESTRFHRGDWLTAPDGGRVIINHLKLRGDGSVLAYCQRANGLDVVTVELPNNHKDRGVLINSARFHGFDYYSETLTDADYALLNDWIEYFWPESGTQSYVRFMGFIKHIELFADPLWTSEIGIGGENDEYPSLEVFDSDTIPVQEGGHDYSTSHVQLRYDVLTYPNPDEADLVQLFYLLAPIALVLERIAHDINAEDLTLQTAVAGSLAVHDGANLPRETVTRSNTTATFNLEFGGAAVHDGAELPRETVTRTRLATGLILQQPGAAVHEGGLLQLTLADLARLAIN